MRVSRPSWYLASIATLVVARLILISHDEILAFPYDESAYIGQAGAWYWKNQYTDWTYSRQPGYPLFLAMGSLLGIPARLVIEGAWIGVSLLLVHALGRAGVGRALRLVALGLLVFHPFPTQLFCRVLSENLYTTAFMAGLPALAMAITRRSRRSTLHWGLLAGTAFAIAGITRQETVLNYILIAGAGAIVLKAAILRTLPRRLTMRRLMLGCLMPLVIALGAEHAVRGANYARIGAYVTYDWSLPGFKALYRTMLSIPPESARLRVPIPKDVREKAAAASPAYARLLDAMSDPRCASHWRGGERTTGVAGEPGSFNLWLMREAAWVVRDYKFANARETDEFYWNIVREIREAQGRGELARRWAPMSFIPPEWGQLVMAVPASLPVCWRMMTVIGFERGEPYAVGDVERRWFDAVALRRQALLDQEPVFGVEMRRAKVVARFDAVKRTFAAALPWFTVGSIVLAVAGSFAAQFARGRLPSAWFAMMALLWAAFVLRLLLVATLDATGVVAMNRYMFTSAVLLVPMGVLGLHAIMRLARMRLESKKAGQAVRDATCPPEGPKPPDLAVRP